MLSARTLRPDLVIVAINRGDGQMHCNPEADEVLRAGELMVVGHTSRLRALDETAAQRSQPAAMPLEGKGWS